MVFSCVKFLQVRSFFDIRWVDMLDGFGSLGLLDGSHLCYGSSTVQRQSRMNFL